jgi:hypothetical protein
MIRALPAYRRGLAEALIIMIMLASLSWVFFAAFHVRPGAEVLRALAQIGATLLVAYGVVASSIISAAQVEPPDKRKERLGALVGIGAAGMAAIATALVLSERACIANPNPFEEFAFGWTSAALLMFLVMVALQADALDSWKTPAPTPRRSRWLTRNRRRSS